VVFVIDCDGVLVLAFAEGRDDAGVFVFPPAVEQEVNIREFSTSILVKRGSFFIDYVSLIIKDKNEIYILDCKKKARFVNIFLKFDFYSCSHSFFTLDCDNPFINRSDVLHKRESYPKRIFCSGFIFLIESIKYFL
jgi:hypothetical protein